MLKKVAKKRKPLLIQRPQRDEKFDTIYTLKWSDLPSNAIRVVGVINNEINCFEAFFNPESSRIWPLVDPLLNFFVSDKK